MRRARWCSCGDVTDVRRRDRALLTKDATIREIHHRVKNNLQTVAAPLRLQARRMTEPAARAALEESVRRVASIAVVHDTLAGSREDVVAVDDVLDQVPPMLGDLASIGQAACTCRTGSFGSFRRRPLRRWCWRSRSCCTTPRSTPSPKGVLGIIELVAERDGDDLVVRVRDDGKDCPTASIRGERRAGTADRAHARRQRTGRQPDHDEPAPGRRGRDRGAADHPRRRSAPPLRAEAGPESRTGLVAIRPCCVGAVAQSSRRPRRCAPGYEPGAA